MLKKCFLPVIPERLTETLRTNPSPAVSAQIFLMFRVLLLRISSHHLTSLWPIMVTELVSSLLFGHLFKKKQLFIFIADSFTSFPPTPHSRSAYSRA